MSCADTHLFREPGVEVDGEVRPLLFSASARSPNVGIYGGVLDDEDFDRAGRMPQGLESQIFRYATKTPAVATRTPATATIVVVS